MRPPNWQGACQCELRRLAQKRSQVMALILDTGPVLALLDADDPAHARCAALRDAFDELLVLVATTLVSYNFV